MATNFTQTQAIDETALRNEDFQTLYGLLNDQQAHKVDLVTPAAALRAEDGMITITGAEPLITADGVLTVDGPYRPTSVMLDGIAGKLGIPSGYLKRLHQGRRDLFDQNVNGWLHGRAPVPGQPAHPGTVVRGDDRSFLVRTFHHSTGEGPGVARAFLSDKYKTIDNLDVLTATLAGVQDAGVEIDIRGCDLTDSRMYVRVHAEGVKAHAPQLLKGYRSPFTGATGDENPIVFAGFLVSNSEVGAGRFTITPQLVVEVCSNGLTITSDIKGMRHAGGQMDEGLIDWSDDTRAKELAVIQAKARDAVKTFLDVDYVQHTIAALEETASTPITKAADTVVRSVGKSLSFSEERTAGVLEYFIRGGQHTAGGVMQAVTAYAQIIPDADAAAEVESQGVRAMELAAAATK